MRNFPDASKMLVSGLWMHPAIAFGRASTGTYLGRDGLLQTAPVNTPRYQYDVNGNLQGLLIEGAATNLLRYSGDVSNAAWSNGAAFTLAPVTSVVPGYSATLCTNLGGVGSRAVSQTFTPNGTTACASVIVEQSNANPSTDMSIGIYSGSFVALGRFTWATGVAGITSGSGTVSAKKLSDSGPNGGALYKISVVGSVTSGSTYSVLLYPSGTSANTAAAIIHGVQAEVGSAPTSYIPTTTAAVTRSADAAIINDLTKIGYSATQGSLIAAFEIDSFNPSTRAPVSVTDDPVVNNYVLPYVSATGLSATYATDRAGTLTSPAQAGITTPLGVANKIAMSWLLGGVVQGASNGVAGGSTGALTGADFSGCTVLRVGNFAGNPNYLNGCVKSLAYYPTALSAADLARLTS